MSTSSAPEHVYPPYCFHLSPTLNTWCYSRIADVHVLKAHPGFAGQDIYFYLNHPIKWIRVAGLVVAIDKYETRRIYTLDDSSGRTIECVVTIFKQKPGANGTKNPANTNRNENDDIKMENAIRLGDVLEVKGGLRKFRNQMQIHVKRMLHLQSTEKEVAFWRHAVELRNTTLSAPWWLDKEKVEECRRRAEGTSSRVKRAKEARNPLSKYKARKAVARRAADGVGKVRDEERETRSRRDENGERAILEKSQETESGASERQIETRRVRGELKGHKRREPCGFGPSHRQNGGNHEERDSFGQKRVYSRRHSTERRDHQEDCWPKLRDEAQDQSQISSDGSSERCHDSQSMRISKTSTRVSGDDCQGWKDLEREKLREKIARIRLAAMGKPRQKTLQNAGEP